ncbi:M20 metallopeptidase family protein [Nonomuraea jiangxiensis]|uniref:Amidohydrolase n=1 Tax=Nonomuraea jiangxiensis TaxID=633440 RepID=A0A1G9J494_9ACTN|nr:M20/M25/M40 family metallo-hydrolase [Nonomuraea jiangxiensis]SDL32161.1 amidohydrolase [Nonomuraea jiangxiensis]
MFDSGDRTVSRRAVLGGAVAGVAGDALGPARAAYAGGMPSEGDPVDAVAAQLDRDLIALRRDLHRHPELPGQERRTAEVVARRLRAAGLDVTTGVGGHGVVGVLEAARRGRTVAYRADIDAVPPEDQLSGGTQVAHLCGHDVHTAVGVGVAEVLAHLRDRLAGTFVFVFQPAEEALSGAAAMLDDGVLARTRPTEIHALHCGPFPVGEFVVTPGFGLPGQDHGVITLTGPDATARAQRLAAAIGALGTVSPPSTPEALERFVADLLTPDGPLSTFVFMQVQTADTTGGAEVRMSYRCWPEDRYEDVRADIGRLARSHGGTPVFPKDPYPAMLCPEWEGHVLKRHLEQTIGPDRVRTIQAAVPFSGEDFALFLDRIPGTYTFLGVMAPGAPITTGYPHFGAFNPDERAIGHGVRAMARWLAVRAARR